MTTATSLRDLSVGQRARVQAVTGPRAHRRRLLELGLVPGTPVEVVRRMPAGDVLELAARDGRLSVRLSEADALLVEPEA